MFENEELHSAEIWRTLERISKTLDDVERSLNGIMKNQNESITNEVLIELLKDAPWNKDKDWERPRRDFFREIENKRKRNVNR